MKDITDAMRARIAQIIDRAWPCYVHYANPAELAGNQEIRKVLAQLDALVPNTKSEGLPIKVPSPLNVTESMVLGHERHPRCITLARAITRCLPALTQAVIDERFPSLDDSDPEDIRNALAVLHGLYHLDPTTENDTEITEALCITQTPPIPIEIGNDWHYMVRLTQDHRGAQLGALQYMPMRCFANLPDARNWSLLQAIWDCDIPGEDHAANLADPNYQRTVRDLTHHDGSNRTWPLPFSNAKLRFTRHHDGR